MHTVVLIPSYNPQHKLVALVAELAARNHEVLVVNDGSKEEYNFIFEEAKAYATVLSYEQNHGKGYALKTGIRALLDRPEVTGFVTADGDGQHAIADIEKTIRLLEEKDQIILGVRNLTNEIPLRSQVGNDMSKVTYTLTTGKYLSDNQAGLRGFPTRLGEWLLQIAGDHYEYEMNVLAEAAFCKFRIIETQIETIYEDEANSTSHFKPVLDTIRIQHTLLKNDVASVLFYLLAATGMMVIYYLKYPWYAFIVWTLAVWALQELYVIISTIVIKERKLHARKSLFIFAKYLVTFGIMVGFSYGVHIPVIGIAISMVLVPVITYYLGKFRLT